MGVNSKHKKILQAIFTKPTPSNIRWKDIEILVLSLGCEIKEGNGSRIRFCFRNIRHTFHKPHPSPYAMKGAVIDVCKFLINIGIKYED